MLNPMINTGNTPVAVTPQMPTTQVKDTQWLTLEVCREFQRSKCSRSDTECKYAHPPPHVEVQNGRVTACFDSIKGKCQRKEPPCKYLHPPQHLKEVLLQNGRRNLILKNSMISNSIPYLSMPTYVPGYAPAVYRPLVPAVKLDRTKEIIERNQALLQTHPYYTTQSPQPQYIPWQHYINNMYPTGIPIPMQQPTDNCAAVIAQQAPAITNIPHSPVTTAVTNTPKATRPDRLEVCREYRRGICTRTACECRYAHPPDTVAVDYNDNHVTVCLDYVKAQCQRDNCRYFHPPGHLQNQNTIPGMVPITKRMAIPDNSKGGIPMYQPAMTMSAYQQALAMQLQPQYIPTVSATTTSVQYAPHPATLTRY